MAPVDFQDHIEYLEQRLKEANLVIEKKNKVINKNNNKNIYYQGRKDGEKEEMRSQVSRLKNQLDALYKDMDITKDSSTNMYNNFRDGVKLLIGNKSSVGSVSSVVSRSGKKRPNELVRTESDVVSHLHYVVDKLHDENAILREENRYNNIHVEESRSLIDFLDEKSGPTSYALSVRCEELSNQGNDWREDYQKQKKRHEKLSANFKEVHESENYIRTY